MCNKSRPSLMGRGTASGIVERGLVTNILKHLTTLVRRLQIGGLNSRIFLELTALIHDTQ